MQVPLLALVGTLAAFCWSQERGFVEGQGPHRPAGSTAVVESLPRGLTCRRGVSQIVPNRYGRDSPEYDPAEPAIVLPYGSEERAEWKPIPQWRGEKTYHPCKKLQDDKYRQWYHFDAEGKTLGHLAKAVARTIEGLDSPLYDPARDKTPRATGRVGESGESLPRAGGCETSERHTAMPGQQDVGAYAIVTNCERVRNLRF
ncbi:rplM [Symbiodinium natans]|uniref:RplM protein n=1 Tax=Symbiodinium natans TaxID=878477 RepID=A0A812TS35_9DINO|nr:rplM [Symbiodinium natans]